MTVPPIDSTLTGPALVAAINDRFRRLSLGSGAGSGGSSAAYPQLLLFIATDFTPGLRVAELVSIGSDQRATSLVALIKVPPDGGVVKFSVWTGNPIDGGQSNRQLVGRGMIKNQDPGVVTVKVNAMIPANSVVTLSIDEVGTTITGAGLTVIVRF